MTRIRAFTGSEIVARELRHGVQPTSTVVVSTREKRLLIAPFHQARDLAGETNALTSELLER